MNIHKKSLVINTLSYITNWILFEPDVHWDVMRVIDRELDEIGDSFLTGLSLSPVIKEIPQIWLVTKDRFAWNMPGRNVD